MLSVHRANEWVCEPKYILQDAWENWLSLQELLGTNEQTAREAKGFLLSSNREIETNRAQRWLISCQSPHRDVVDQPAYS